MDGIFLVIHMWLHHSEGCHRCNYLENLKKVMEVWEMEVNGRPRAFEDVDFKREIGGPR